MKIVIHPNRPFDEQVHHSHRAVVQFETEFGTFNVRIAQNSNISHANGALVIESVEGETIAVLSPSAGNQIVVKVIE